MKAKVVKRFRDKVTREIFEKNSVYEGSEKRVKEIQKIGYLGETIKEPKKKNKAKEGE